MDENLGDGNPQGPEEERLSCWIEILRADIDRSEKLRASLQESYDQIMKNQDVESIQAIRQSMEKSAFLSVINANSIKAAALRFASLAANSASNSSSGSHVLHVSHTKAIKDKIAELVRFFSEFLQTMFFRGTGDHTRLPQSERFTIQDYEVLTERIGAIFMLAGKLTEARQLLSEIDLKVPENRQELSGSATLGDESEEDLHLQEFSEIEHEVENLGSRFSWRRHSSDYPRTGVTRHLIQLDIQRPMRVELHHTVREVINGSLEILLALTFPE